MFVLLLLLLAPQLEDLTEIEEGHSSFQQSSLHLRSKNNNKRQSFSSPLSRASPAGDGGRWLSGLPPLRPGSLRRRRGATPAPARGVGTLRGRPLCQARPAGRAAKRLAPGRPSGGGTCPDARPSTGPARRARVVRTPAATAVRPVSRRVSRGVGHSGIGTRPAASEAGSRLAELSRPGPGARGLLRSRLHPQCEVRASPWALGRSRRRCRSRCRRRRRRLAPSRAHAASA